MQTPQAKRNEAEEFSFVHIVGTATDGPFEQVDLTPLGGRFISFRERSTAPPEIAKTYLESLTAPRKRF